MKKIINITGLLLIAGCMVFTGCENFLREEGLPRLTPDFYETSQGVESATTAVYSFMRWGAGGERYDAMNEFGADLFMATPEGGRGDDFDAYGAGLNPSQTQLYQLWENHYKAISAANLVISRVQASEDLNAEIIEQTVAEMLFLRAYYYFDLVQHFGRIPLVLDASFEVRTNFTRSSVADIYAQIIEDLEYAVEKLEPTSALPGRANKYTAAHLLARAYLTRGSAVTDQRGQQPTDMANALKNAELVINSGQYELLDDFSALWGIENEDNNEVIFSVQFSTDPIYNGDGNWFHLFWVPNYEKIAGMQRDIENGRPYRRYNPTNKTMFELFDRKNDSRFYKSFKWVYYCNNPNETLALGDTAAYFSLHPKPVNATYDYTYYQWDKVELKNNYDYFPPLAKHLDPRRTTQNQQQGTRNWVRMRLGETYLIAAEAAGRGNDFATAVKYINEIRKRAAWHDGENKYPQYWREEGGEYGNTQSTYPEIEVSQNDIQHNFTDFMLNERGRELLGEVYRWEDLVRCEKLAEYVTAFNPNATGFKPHHKLRPIPQNHIDRLNPRGSVEEEQNEGYY